MQVVAVVVHLVGQLVQVDLVEDNQADQVQMLVLIHQQIVAVVLEPLDRVNL